jgi:hypothetical protein
MLLPLLLLKLDERVEADEEEGFSTHKRVHKYLDK